MIFISQGSTIWKTTKTIQIESVHLTVRKIQKNLNQGKPVENPISIFEICKKLHVKADKIYVKNFIACVHFQFVTTAPHLWDRVGNSGGNVHSYNLSIVPEVWGKCRVYNFTPK